MSIPKDLLRERPELSKWSILTAYRGSITHNMYVPNSDPNSIDDKDVICVCIPPQKFYYGLKQYGSRGTKELKRDEWDIVIYEFRKYISLLIKGNPNVLSSLWLKPQHYLNLSDEGEWLIRKRDLFVSKQVYHSFAGYANGQFHRMTHIAFEGYMGEKRKRLVEKYGYDTKNASHLIRLLKMCIEFLTEGKLYVEREDNQELLAIKRGEWSLQKIEKLSEELFKQARYAYISSKLPNDVDRNAIDDLCVDILENRFYRWGVKTLSETQCQTTE